MLCLATFASVALVACARRAAAPDEAPSGSVAAAPVTPATSPPARATRAVPDEATRKALAGWWLRHDQSYMIVIDAIGADGLVEARYLNPQPVNVSRAEAWTEEGVVRLLLELTDEKYPGSFYELAYQPDQDLWIGVYHHLGVGQDFEVYFTRFEEEEE